MEPQNNERLPLELSSQLVSITTTEHYNLQTGRSMTISEANGRSSLFVGAVKWIGCPGLCRADLPPGNSLFRV